MKPYDMQINTEAGTIQISLALNLTFTPTRAGDLTSPAPLPATTRNGVGDEPPSPPDPSKNGAGWASDDGDKPQETGEPGDGSGGKPDPQKAGAGF